MSTRTGNSINVNALGSPIMRSSVPFLKCGLYLLAGALTVGLVLVPPVHAQLTDATWVAGVNGNWSVPGNWVPATVPSDGGGIFYHVFIDGGNPLNSICHVNITPTITALDVSASDQLWIDGANLAVSVGPVPPSINNAGAIHIGDARLLWVLADASGATVTNSGTISLESGGNTTMLSIGGPVTLSGPGALTLNGNVNNLVNWVGGANDSLTQTAGHTISGGGNLGNTVLPLVNHGLIDANLNGETFYVRPNSVGLVNTATVQARNGGTIRLENGPVDNTGGLITALAGSQVQITVAVSNGTLSSVGTGSVAVNGSGTTLSNVTLPAGTNLNIPDAQATALVGTITNNGTIAVASGGNTTVLGINGPVALAGSGNLTLNGNVNNLVNWTGHSNDALTIGANQTVSGGGVFGNTVMPLINNGLLDADLNGDTLYVRPSAAGIANPATIRARNGGIIRFDNGPVDNTNGLITALAGSQIQVAGGVSISNGILSSVGTGNVAISGSGTTLSDVTLPAGTNVSIPDAQATMLIGTITNNGTIAMTSGGNTTVLGINGPVTLAGSGSLTLGGNVNNLVNWTGHANDALTIGASQTISGGGVFGNTVMPLVNDGLIDADLNGDTLYVRPSAAGIANPATIRARNGGIIRFDNGPVDNTGGLITALTGSQVQIAGSAALSNGTLSSVGTGNVAISGAGTSLSNVTLPAGTNLNIPDAQYTVLVGTITNNATIAMTSGGNSTSIGINGPVTLAGSGSLTLGGNVNNLVNWTGHANDALTIGASQTVSGEGNIGNGVMAITNNGSINANISGATLSLNANAVGALVNATSGLMEATNGGTLSFPNAQQLANHGTVTAGSGSTVQIGAGPLPLDIGNGSLTGSGTVIGDVSNATGTVSPGASPGTLTIQGTYSQDGGILHIELGGTGAGQFDVLSVTGHASVGGMVLVTLVNGFTPTIGQSFQVLTAGSVSGLFGMAQSSPATFGIAITYTASTVTLHITQPPRLGDLNCDGVVNFDDIDPFVQILSDLGGWQTAHPTCPLANGDCNADGAINFDDIDAFVAILSGGS